MWTAKGHLLGFASLALASGQPEELPSCTLRFELRPVLLTTAQKAILVDTPAATEELGALFQPIHTFLKADMKGVSSEIASHLSFCYSNDDVIPSCSPLLSLIELPVLDNLAPGAHFFRGWVSDVETNSSGKDPPLCESSARYTVAPERCCRGILDNTIELRDPSTNWLGHVRGLDLGGGGDKVGLLNVNLHPITDSFGKTSEIGKVYEILVTNATALKAFVEMNQGVEPTIMYFRHDLTTSLPFDDGSVELIFSEHFIEHVSMGDAVAVLAEARRLLAKGGTLRLATPDFGKFASAYALAAAGDARGDEWFRSQFKVLSKTTGINSLHPYMSPRPMDIINQVFMSYGHAYLYDFEQLRYIAELAGWTQANNCQVSRTVFREPGLDTNGGMFLASMDDPKHIEDSLYAVMTCT